MTGFKIKVWVVEDNDIYRQALVRSINSTENMQCDFNFNNAESLLTKLSQGIVPDVILLDVQLPEMDGITALNFVKKINVDVKTIILTVFDDSDKIFRAVCAGASGYILKSGIRSEVGDVIEEVMNGGAPMTPSVAKKVLSLFSNLEQSNSKKADYQLSERELEVLRLMAEGLIKKEIADKLKLSTHTINTHIRNIYIKLHVDTNTGAVAKGIRENLV